MIASSPGGPDAPETPPPARVAVLAALLAVAAAVLGAFSPSLANGFVALDDVKNFLANPRYRGLGAEELAWMFTSNHTGHYIPVTWLTLGLDYVLWGLEPAGYHLTSLLFHLANALLFTALASRLFSRLPGAEGAPVARALGAAAAGVLFGAHPLRVESVAWASERRDVVCGIFTLLSLHAYVTAAGRDGSRRARWLGASVAEFVLALLSKGIAVVLPVALVALDAGVLGRLPLRPRDLFAPARRAAHRTALREKLLFGGVAALFSGVTLWAIRYVLAPAAELSVSSRLLSAVWGLSFYVERSLWPGDLPLVVPRLAPLSLATPGVAPRLAAVLGGAALLVGLSRRFPRTALAFGTYAAFVLPVSGLLQAGPQLAAHRYTYLATMPLALLAGAGVCRLASAGGSRAWGVRLLVGFALLPLAVGLVARTRRQVAFWKDGLTFAAEAVRGAPTAWRPRYHLAVALAAADRHQEAVRQLRIGLSREPASGELAVAAALLLATSPDDAVRDADEAARLAERASRRLPPSDVRVSLALSAVAAERRDFEGAASLAEAAAARARDEGNGGAATALSRAARGYRDGRPLRLSAADWDVAASGP